MSRDTDSDVNPRRIARREEHHRRSGPSARAISAHRRDNSDFNGVGDQFGPSQEPRRASLEITDESDGESTMVNGRLEPGPNDVHPGRHSDGSPITPIARTPNLEPVQRGPWLPDGELIELARQRSRERRRNANTATRSASSQEEPTAPTTAYGADDEHAQEIHGLEHRAPSPTFTQTTHSRFAESMAGDERQVQREASSPRARAENQRSANDSSERAQH